MVFRWFFIGFHWVFVGFFIDLHWFLVDFSLLFRLFIIGFFLFSQWSPVLFVMMCFSTNVAVRVHIPQVQSACELWMSAAWFSVLCGEGCSWGGGGGALVILCNHCCSAMH